MWTWSTRPAACARSGWPRPACSTCSCCRGPRRRTCRGSLRRSPARAPCRRPSRLATTSAAGTTATRPTRARWTPALTRMTSPTTSSGSTSSTPTASGARPRARPRARPAPRQSQGMGHAGSAPSPMRARARARYLTWDAAAFPAPAALQEDLASRGRRMVTIVDPHIKRDPGYYIYAEAARQDFFVKDRDGNEFDGRAPRLCAGPGPREPGATATLTPAPPARAGGAGRARPRTWTCSTRPRAAGGRSSSSWARTRAPRRTCTSGTT